MNFQKLSDLMDRMVQGRTPGCAVLIYKDGKEVFRKAAGLSSIEANTPMTGKELLNLYSCSKIATVSAALTLLEEGRFHLNDPLYDYIPEFKDMKVYRFAGGVIPAKEPIRIRNLFNMTAGFDYNGSNPAFQEASEATGGQCPTLETVRRMAKQPLQFEPGTWWKYSYCHDVLGAFVEVVSGMKFRDYVKKAIFEPLGMDDSYYHLTPEIESRMAEQYQFVTAQAAANMDLVEALQLTDSGDGYFVNVGKENNMVLGPEFDSGGAGLISTLDDYMKLLAALTNFGKGLNGNRILSSQTVKLMKTNSLSPELLKGFELWPQFRGYGYGLGVRTLIDPIQAGSLSPIGEFAWGGAAGSTAYMDTGHDLAAFFVQHTLNPREDYYMPRVRNAIYAGLDD